MKTAFIFPGQASQKVGMGEDLYLSNSNVRKSFEVANDIMGFDFKKIIFNGPAEVLKKTIYTQPAIYLISVIIAKILIKKGVKPQCAAGHSLGEYSALTIANAFDFESGFELVKLRSEAMQSACEEKDGTMAAVLGLDDAIVEKICNDWDSGIVVAANFNCKGQVVISGELNSISEISQKLKEAGAKKILEINVGGAFHSPLMTSAKDKLKKKLNQTALNDSSIPVYSNFTSKAVTNKDDILDSLINQIDSPVYWHQSITNIKSDGFDNFIEVGPGKVLQTLCKRIDSTLSISGVESNHQINELTNV